MKWKNRGHEFDRYAEKLGAREGYTKYYIFGAGIVGGNLLSTLHAYHCVAAFIDNDTQKQQTTWKGYKIISLDTYLQKKDGLILIAVADQNISTIEMQLETASLTKGSDFFVWDVFMQTVFPIISTYYYDKAYVHLAQISLTERCTLKCKKCAHGCYAVDNHAAEDMSLQEAFHSADCFFAKVDFIYDFVLIGGEPLLYAGLTQVIRYIGERYRNQIGMFSITTNGTIIPNAEVLRVCKDYDVRFMISNYTVGLPQLESIQRRLTRSLEEAGVLYSLGHPENQWMDYGFEYLNRNASEDELIKVFDGCATPCREIRGSHFYYCVMARSVSENLDFQVGTGDYLDLDTLTGENYKKELLEFTMGYSEKGYLDMCNHCNGADAKKYLIPAAEQIRP